MCLGMGAARRRRSNGRRYGHGPFKGENKRLGGDKRKSGFKEGSRSLGGGLVGVDERRS